MERMKRQHGLHVALACCEHGKRVLIDCTDGREASELHMRMREYRNL